MFNFYTHLIAERHFADSGDHAMTVKCICGNNTACTDIFCKLPVLFHNFIIDRKIIIISVNTQPDQFIARLFQLRCDNLLLKSHIYSKGNQRRRYINILECSGHTVLSSDRRKAETDLRSVCAKESSKRLAPAFRILCHSAEILLESKPDLSVIPAGSDNLCH